MWSLTPQRGVRTALLFQGWRLCGWETGGFRSASVALAPHMCTNQDLPFTAPLPVPTAWIRIRDELRFGAGVREPSPSRGVASLRGCWEAHVALATQGLVHHSVFSPSRALRPLPRHLRSVCQGCRRPTWSLPTPSASPPSPLIHRQPWLTGSGWGGGRVGAGWPGVTLLLLAQGPPSRCSMGPSWPWMQMRMYTLWSPTSCWASTAASLISTTAQVRPLHHTSSSRPARGILGTTTRSRASSLVLESPVPAAHIPTLQPPGGGRSQKKARRGCKGLTKAPSLSRGRALTPFPGLGQRLRPLVPQK